MEARWSTDEFQKKRNSRSPQQDRGQSQLRIFESVFKKKKKQRKGAELCAALLRALGSLCFSIVRGGADWKCVVSRSNDRVRPATFYGFYFLGEEIAGI